MGRFVPCFSGLRRGIEVFNFVKQLFLPCAIFYANVGFSPFWKGDWTKVIKPVMM